ncbi:MAG: DMT family transporter [Nocardioidaceae bacterium]
MGLATVLLALAIGIEVAATASLPRTDGFTNVLWTAAVLVAYAMSFALLAIVVRDIPVSVAYAVWSGAGTALVAVIGATLLGERLDTLKVTAIGFIVVGVVMLNVRGVH